MSGETITEIITERPTGIITGNLPERMEMFLQSPHSWTVVRRQMEFLKYFRMATDLSAAPIIFQVRTIFMFLLPRSAALT